MSVILAMCLYALSMSITPGPVNLITLSIGVNTGFKSAMPFVSGAGIGFGLLLYAVGLGFHQLVLQFALLMQVLGLLGCAFIGYTGYKIIRSSAQLQLKNTQRPGFVQGFVLQWLNPKAWIASVAGISAFGLADSHTQLLLFVSLYFMICYLSISTWALMGAKISGLLTMTAHLRRFNRLMGSSLIVVALYLVFAQVTS